MFALLVCCTTVCADPFAPLPTAPNEAEAPAAAYRVVGAAILGERAVAVMRMADGRFRTVRLGERVGDATVIAITLDAVHLKTALGVSRWPVTD